MFNKRKILGIITGLLGVFISRLNLWLEEGSSQVFFIKITGILIACVGIAVYGSGIKGIKDKIIRVCPHCYAKNNAEKASCRKCKKPLEKASGE
jgi:hypothetical protein